MACHRFLSAACITTAVFVSAVADAHDVSEKQRAIFNFSSKIPGELQVMAKKFGEAEYTSLLAY